MAGWGLAVIEVRETDIPEGAPPSAPEPDMPPASRRLAASLLTLAALVPLPILATTGPASAFQVGDSPDFNGCAVWLNDAGEPLRTATGREVGRKAPCGGQTHSRDVYETLPGEAPGTLVIRDATHQVECLMVLRPGSATVLVQKACQGWDG